MIPIIGGSTEVATPAPRLIMPWEAEKPKVITIKQKAATSAATFKYEHPDMGDNPGDDPHLAADLAMSKQLAELKEECYPGHPFEFEVDTSQGVILISLPALMGPINRYVVHIRDLYGDPKMTAVKRGCGEILERYRLPRTGYSRDDFAAAVTARPVVFRRHEDVPE